MDRRPITDEELRSLETLLQLLIQDSQLIAGLSILDLKTNGIPSARIPFTTSDVLEPFDCGHGGCETLSKADLIGLLILGHIPSDRYRSPALGPATIAQVSSIMQPPPGSVEPMDLAIHC